MKWLLAGAMLLALPAMAKEGDTFRPFVSLGYFYDSNLFRLDENESPGTQRDDRYALLSAGANVDWKPGRQQVVANLTKTLIRYDQNTYLDFEGDDMQATWNWRLGNRISGNLGAAKSTSQSSFSDIGLVNNQVDRERRYGRAEWEFHPRWRIGGGLETTDNTNSAPSQLSQNVQQQVQDVVLSYRTPKGSNLRAQARRIDADFPNQQLLRFVFPFFVEVADNSFKQTEYNLLGDWRLSGKLTLRGQAGWVDRQYKNELKDDLGGAALLNERPDFSGFTGRVSVDWYATGKTLLSVAAYREPGGATDINASSLLKTGASVNGVWLMREKWRLNLGATYENRDYKGDPGATQPQRNDDTLGSLLSVTYTPHRAVALDLGARAGSRDSNISGEDYSFHSLFATVRADF
ncbi:MAG: outer membrane beta-barrel protein [Deltaproteobacteria bacterium]|nr:outer membrane beta-barrel protein [Deltaproteobacteria bacterium]